MCDVTVQLARGTRAVCAGVLLPPVTAAVVDARRRDAAVCGPEGTGQVTGRVRSRGQVTGGRVNAVTGSGHGVRSGHEVRSRGGWVIGQVIGQAMGQAVTCEGHRETGKVTGHRSRHRP